MRAKEFLNEVELKLSDNQSLAKKFIDEIYSKFPTNPLNNNEVILYQTSGQVVLFDLKPSQDKNRVHISFMRAVPKRAGAGKLGMKKLQHLAGERGLGLDLFVWKDSDLDAEALQRFYQQLGFRLGKNGLMIWEPPSKLDEVNIDNQEGKGTTGVNREVDYYGISVMMKPSTFLNLAARLSEPTESLPYLIDYIKQGGAIGSPFLSIEIPKGWEKGDFSSFAKVIGHEGRHRMKAVQELEGDNPIEVHLFPLYYRSRHITPDWIKKLNAGLWSETAVPKYDIGLVKGPLFSVK